MIQRGDRILVIATTDGRRVELALSELDAVIAALELVRKSEREGLRVDCIAGDTWRCGVWTAGS